MTRTDVTARVVAVCGSLRSESTTRTALREVLAASREAGASTELVDLRSHALPNLHAVEEPVEGADAIRNRIAGADTA